METTKRSTVMKVEAYEESGEFPGDVEFVELETDVGWYGRQCRRRLRNQVGPHLTPLG